MPLPNLLAYELAAMYRFSSKATQGENSFQTKYCPADSELTIFLPARSAPPVDQLADHTPANVTMDGERFLVGDDERYGCLENVPDILPEIKCKRLSW